MDQYDDRAFQQTANNQAMEIIPSHEFCALPISGKIDLVTSARLSWGVGPSQEIWAMLRLPLTPSMNRMRYQKGFDL